MKVRFLGTIDTLAFEKDKIYDVISVEKGWYRIMTELDEDYLFPPKLFEAIDDGICEVPLLNRTGDKKYDPPL